MSKMHRIILTFILLFLLNPAQSADGKPDIIRMATTTSTENSGLLKSLLPAFEQKSGQKAHVIAVGTGKALRMGRDGDVDLVLVHAPAAEARFIQAGYGVDRHAVMYNDFVIVGPVEDPSGISQGSDASDSLQKIAGHQALFISRGDDSGTHKKELDLWKKAGITPRGEWYREAGQGMGKVLQMSGELDAYTLTDRGTWLAFQAKLPLKIIVEGDPRLYNPYSIMAVNPKRHPDTNYSGASALIRWITSHQGQQIIGDYTIAGQHLFTPSAATSKLANQ